MKRIILDNVRIMILAIIFSLGIGIAYAWTAPTEPPTGKVMPSVINTSSTFQSKDGQLWVGALGVSGGLVVQSGKVGIGTGNTAPGAMLDVVGDAKATSFLYSSDVNLKKNIKPLGNELDKIMALRPVSFDWKSDDSSDIGFIAQEVEKIFPEVVHTNKTTNLKSIDYPKLTVFLVQALQEQQKQIEQLKLNK